MPFVFLFAGLLLVIAGARDKTSTLGTLIANDFAGPTNFFYWAASIGAVGAVGYYTPLRNVSRLFLALILLSMLIADQGFFVQLQDALKSIKTPKPAPESAVGAATADTGATVSGPFAPNSNPTDAQISAFAEAERAAAEKARQGYLGGNFSDKISAGVGKAITDSLTSHWNQLLNDNAAMGTNLIGKLLP